MQATHFFRGYTGILFEPTRTQLPQCLSPDRLPSPWQSPYLSMLCACVSVMVCFECRLYVRLL